jgi:hypothetical protein
MELMRSDGRIRDVITPGMNALFAHATLFVDRDPKNRTPDSFHADSFIIEYLAEGLDKKSLDQLAKFMSGSALFRTQSFMNKVKRKVMEGNLCEYSSESGLVFGDTNGNGYLRIDQQGKTVINSEFFPPDASRDNKWIPGVGNGDLLRLHNASGVLHAEYATPLVLTADGSSRSLWMNRGVTVVQDTFQDLNRNTFEQIDSKSWGDGFAYQVISPYVSLECLEQSKK